jgi:DNA polymerase-3 subunit delta'
LISIYFLIFLHHLKFSEIHGHEEIKGNLASVIRQGRIPHAQMIISREGNAALPLALAYAQYASCLDKSSDDSCGVCSSCVKYKQLIHPDLHLSFPIFGSNETCDDFIRDFRAAFLANPMLTLNDWLKSIDGENKKPNINIKECRNIIRKLSLRAYESEYKVLLMWLPEYLGKEGNVLLKLLEEPPANTLFLLVTENQDQILTTIISRTQFIKVPVYSYEEIDSYLRKHQLASEEVSRNVALMAEGNLSKAISLAGEMENTQFESFRLWLLDCYNGNLGKIIGEADQYTDKGKEGLKMFLLYGIQMIRSALLIQHQSMENKLTPNEIDFVSRLSKFIQLDNAREIYQALNQAIFEIDRNGSTKLILINLSLKLKYSLRPKVNKTA